MEKLDSKLLTETCSVESADTMTNTDDISCTLQKLHVSDAVDENVNNLDVNLNADFKESIKNMQQVDRNRYKDIRKWKKIGKGKVLSV